MDPSILGAGGSADPMIRLHLSGEREKTLIKRKTLAPVWEETFAMKCDFTSEVLELTLWDFDVTSANDEIGAVYVPVSSMQDRQLHRAWYPVGPVASEDGLVDNLEPLSRHALKCGELVVSSGSVVDAQVSAIVNAANERCLGGGGVDGAITRAGGELLAEKRLALPVHHNKRCKTGDAVITSGGPFSDLKCECVIHAVGPDYRRLPPAKEDEDDDLARGDSILKNAYTAAMKRAKEQKCKTIAFSLLSAGIFRGRQSLDNVLRCAVEAISDATYPGLQRVHLVAFSSKEQEALARVVPYPPIKRGRLELALRWRYDKNFYWEEPEHMLVPEKHPDKLPNRLDVFVSRGKHLPIMDWDRNSPSGGSSDAVCTLTIEGDQRHTSVKLTTLNPTWAEAFEFDAFAGETLRIQVDDWDEDGSLDKIGEVAIPIASLASRKSERRWYAIQHDGPLSEGQPTRGWIEVAGRWSHDPERACDLPGELGEDKPRYSLRPNKLLFYLIRARGLMAADPGNDQQRPTSDPAAILTIPHHPQSDWESAARWTTLVPTWCELFEFEQLDDLGFPLTLTVVDKDEGVDDDDDVLGEVSFDLEKLSDRKTVRGWYPLRPRIDADQYWQRRWQAEREDQSPRAGELCLARAIQAFVPEGSADDASFLKEMGMEEHATVVVLRDELGGEGCIFALRENDAGYVPRHYLAPQDYLGKVEVALRWVHDPLQVEPLPYTFLHPKDIDKPVNALRVRIFKCRSSIKAPSSLRCDVWLDRFGEVAHKHATKSATRLEGTRFTTWADDFLLPLDESDPSSLVFNVRGAQPKVYEESSEEDEYEDLQSEEEEEDVGESVGRLEIPYEKLKRCIVRDWYSLESDDAAKVQALKDAKASMDEASYRAFSKDLLQVQELEIACLLVHDSRVEYESDFRKHVASLQKQEDAERGYTLEDQTQKDDRFYLRFKFQEGNRVRGEFDSYAPLCSRCLLKDKSVFNQPLNHYDPSIKKQDPSVILTKPESEWYVYEVPSHVELARKFHAHHVERNLKENMMTFARKCFNSGYRIEGSSTVEADEAHLMTAIEFKQDFALYLDASREFFDEWADDVFDVYTKTYEGPFTIDGVHYDPDANPPDEDVPMVVKGGWVSGFGEERKAWERIEAGQRERKWREENPHADANEMFARYEEKFRKWNIEEEDDPAAIERRAQAAEEKRKEDMMKGM